VQRCIEWGVRVIEHGTLIDDDTARQVAARGAFVVPTLVIIQVLAENGARLGLSVDGQGKAQSISRKVLQGLDAMRQAQVKVGFGTDLLGDTYVHQCREFRLRREVFSPFEILRQATSVNAAILQQEGRLGCIKTGACADILVVDGDPLESVELLAENGRHVPVIMRGGELVRNELP
jgi:imidazolonepropionase-like amidohydrolase